MGEHFILHRKDILVWGSDLYVTRMQANGQWSTPENLGYPINTKFDENSLMVSAEGEIALLCLK